MNVTYTDTYTYICTSQSYNVLFYFPFFLLHCLNIHSFYTHSYYIVIIKVLLAFYSISSLVSGLLGQSGKGSQLVDQCDIYSLIELGMFVSECVFASTCVFDLSSHVLSIYMFFSLPAFCMTHNIVQFVIYICMYACTYLQRVVQNKHICFNSL